MGILEIPAVHNEAIASLIVKDSLIDRKFLFYILQTLDYSIYLDAYVKGKTLNKDKISSLLLPFPLNNQQIPDISSLLAQNSSVPPLDFNIYYDDRFLGYSFARYIDPIKNIMLKNRFFTLTPPNSHIFSPSKHEAKQLRWFIRYWSQLEARQYYDFIPKVDPQKKQSRS